MSKKKDSYFPSDYVHGLLSYHVGNVKNLLEGKVSFPSNLPACQAVFRKYGINLDDYLSDWVIYRVTDKTSVDYHSVIYQNSSSKHLVLAHKCTDTASSMRNLFEQSSVQIDVDTVLRGMIVQHQIEAYVATEEFIKIHKEHFPDYSLSFTGHSLGAWLAELSVFYTYDNFENYHSKAVTFDGPGSKEMIDKMLDGIQGSGANAKKQEILDNLDITAYFSAPNIVNCNNSHLGKIYRLYPEIDSKDLEDYGIGSYIAKTLCRLDTVASTLSHDMQYMLPEFNPITGIPTHFDLVERWPMIKHQDYGQEAASFLSGAYDYMFGTSLTARIPKKVLHHIVGDTSLNTMNSLATLLSDFMLGKIKMDQFLLVQKYTIMEAKYAVSNLQGGSEFEVRYKGQYELSKDNGIYEYKMGENKIETFLSTIYDSVNEFRDLFKVYFPDFFGACMNLMAKYRIITKLDKTKYLVVNEQYRDHFTVRDVWDDVIKVKAFYVKEISGLDKLISNLKHVEQRLTNKHVSTFDEALDAIKFLDENKPLSKKSLKTILSKDSIFDSLQQLIAQDIFVPSTEKSSEYHSLYKSLFAEQEYFFINSIFKDFISSRLLFSQKDLDLLKVFDNLIPEVKKYQKDSNLSLNAKSSWDEASKYAPHADGFLRFLESNKEIVFKEISLEQRLSFMDLKYKIGLYFKYVEVLYEKSFEYLGKMIHYLSEYSQLKRLGGEVIKKVYHQVDLEIILGKFKEAAEHINQLKKFSNSKKLELKLLPFAKLECKALINDGKILEAKKLNQKFQVKASDKYEIILNNILINLASGDFIACQRQIESLRVKNFDNTAFSDLKLYSGIINLKFDRFDEAIKDFQVSLKSLKNLVSHHYYENNPDVVTLKHYIGLTLLLQNSVAESLEYLLPAYQARTKFFGNELLNESMIASINAMALLNLKQNQVKEASNLMDKLQLPHQPFLEMEYLFHKSLVCVANSQFLDVQSYLYRYLEILEMVYHSDSLMNDNIRHKFVVVLNSLGYSYIHMKEINSDNNGLYYLMKSKKILESKDYSHHSKDLDLGTVYNNIGVIYQNLADYKTSLEYKDKAKDILSQVEGCQDRLDIIVRSIEFIHKILECGKHGIAKELNQGEIKLKNLQAREDVTDELYKDSITIANDLVDNEWYHNDTITELLQHYIKANKCVVGAVLANEEIFISAVQNIDWNHSKQHIFPMNVNVLDGNFGRSNHWVGIKVEKKQGEIIVNYIDPMGEAMSNKITNLLKQHLPNCKIKTKFDQNNKIQHTQKKQQSETVYIDGNDYDCGPFLIYAFSSLINGIIPPVISNIDESIKLGQYLRKVFVKKDVIDFGYSPSIGFSDSNNNNKFEIISEEESYDKVVKKKKFEQLASYIEQNKNTEAISLILKMNLKELEFANDDYDKKTILHLAVENNNFKIVKSLVIKATFLLNSTDGNGNTPLLLAEINEFKDIVDFLKNPTGNGFVNAEENVNYWNEYSANAMEKLLQLRLDSADITSTKIFTPNYVWDNDKLTGTKLGKQIIQMLENEDLILVPLNLNYQHWVGLVFDKIVGTKKINVGYIDPQQQFIPQKLALGLKQGIASLGYEIIVNNTEVDLQKYNNCGPEVIENMIAYFTGERFNQEDAVKQHSNLFEISLLAQEYDSANW